MRLWLHGYLRRCRLAALAASRREDGVAALEFALVLPGLLVIGLGGFAVTEAISTYRKLTDATVETANVAAQYVSMQASDAQAVMSATSQIMTPFPTTALQEVMSLVSTDILGNATVVWSQGYQGGVALPKSSKVTLPTAMAQPNTTYVLVHTTYLYVPVAGSSVIPSVPLSDQIIMLPRASASIPCSTC